MSDEKTGPGSLFSPGAREKGDPGPISFIVAADEAGVRIDRYLAGVLAGHSRSQIQRLIKEGKVQVGGQPVRSNRLVHGGDTIEVDIPEPVAASPPRLVRDWKHKFVASEIGEVLTTGMNSPGETRPRSG